MSEKSPYQTHVKTPYGGGYKRAATLGEARATLSKQIADCNAYHVKHKTGIVVTEAYISDSAGNKIEVVI